MSGTDVYRTWFGLDRLTLNPHGQLLRDYLLLAGDPTRSSDDEKQMQALRDRLAQVGIQPRSPVHRDAP